MQIKKSNWLSKEINRLNKNIDSLTFKYILDFSEKILEILDHKGIRNKNKYLSERLNCSPAYISKLFNGKGNFTIRKLIEITSSIGYDLEINIRPRLNVVQATARQLEIININNTSASYKPIDSYNFHFNNPGETGFTSDLVAS